MKFARPCMKSMLSDWLATSLPSFTSPLLDRPSSLTATIRVGIPDILEMKVLRNETKNPTPVKQANMEMFHGLTTYNENHSIFIVVLRPNNCTRHNIMHEWYLQLIHP